jgi:hypothetical protein
LAEEVEIVGKCGGKEEAHEVEEEHEAVDRIRAEPVKARDQLIQQACLHEYPCVPAARNADSARKAQEFVARDQRHVWGGAYWVLELRSRLAVLTMTSSVTTSTCVCSNEKRLQRKIKK